MFVLDSIGRSQSNSLSLRQTPMFPPNFARLSRVVVAVCAFALWEFIVGLALAGSPATGPLRRLDSNPRYFTDGSGKAVFLTGSHNWPNFKDNGHRLQEN